jgi:hypothetical protein
MLRATMAVLPALGRAQRAAILSQQRKSIMSRTRSMMRPLAMATPATGAGKPELPGARYQLYGERCQGRRFLVGVTAMTSWPYDLGAAVIADVTRKAKGGRLIRAAASEMPRRSARALIDQPFLSHASPLGVSTRHSPGLQQLLNRPYTRCRPCYPHAVAAISRPACARRT